MVDSRRGLWDYSNEAIRAMIPIHLQAKRLEAEKEMQEQAFQERRAMMDEQFKQQAGKMMLDAQNSKAKIKLDMLSKVMDDAQKAGDLSTYNAAKGQIGEIIGTTFPELAALPAGKEPGSVDALIAQKMMSEGKSLEEIIATQKGLKQAGAMSITPYQRESLDLRERESEDRKLVSEENRRLRAESERRRLEEQEEKKRITGEKQARAYYDDTQRLEAITDNLDRLASTANELLNHPGVWGITGVPGKVGDIPGSASSNARALLETLKGQVGFNALQSMRDASKTGGALGQVSDFENKNLQNSLEPLESSKLDEAGLKKSLRGVIEYARKAKERFGKTYKGYWGDFRPNEVRPPKGSQGASSESSPYNSAEDVKAAFKNGRISQEQAIEILQKQFGME